MLLVETAKVTDFNRSVFYLFGIVATFFCAEALYADGNEECRDDEVKCFESYRKAVASGSPNVASFFSKEVNEEWLRSLNRNRSSEDQLAVLGSVRSKATFSRRICTVNRYERVGNQDASKVLNIFYTTADGKGPFLYEVSFVRQMDNLYITSTLSDTTVDGKKYASTVVTEFCKN